MTSVHPSRTKAADPSPPAADRVGVSGGILVKSAGGADPAIAIAAAVPASAASPASTTSSIRARFTAWFARRRDTRYVDITGTDPQHPSDGFFSIADTVGGQTVTDVFVLALIDKKIPDSAWTSGDDVGGAHWTKPVRISGPDAGGFHTYQIAYRAAAVTACADGTLALDARFHFRAPISGNRVKVKVVWHVAITPGAVSVLDVVAMKTADAAGTTTRLPSSRPWSEAS